MQGLGCRVGPAQKYKMKQNIRTGAQQGAGGCNKKNKNKTKNKKKQAHSRVQEVATKPAFKDKWQRQVVKETYLYDKRDLPI